MEPTELRDILERLDWSQGEFGRRIERGEDNGRKIARGKLPIDEPLAEWLRAVDKANTTLISLLDAPPPWRRPRLSEEQYADPTVRVPETPKEAAAHAAARQRSVRLLD
jgi:hypothetical protein